MNARYKSILFVLPLILIVMLGCRATEININTNRQLIQGSGTAVTEQRAVKDIQRVSLRDIGNLTITQGDSESLTVEADDNIISHLKTEMRGSELVLEVEDGYTLNTRTEIHYTLQVKALDRISVSGVGKVSMASLKTGNFSMNISGAGNADFGSLEAQDVALEVSGTGKMTMDNVTMQSLKINSSGAGNFEISGETVSQNVTISGAGSYNGGDLKSSDAEVRISGAGSMTVWAESKLSVNISGFGSVSYYGQPQISQNITGGGSVKSLGTHQ